MSTYDRFERFIEAKRRKYQVFALSTSVMRITLIIRPRHSAKPHWRPDDRQRKAPKPQSGQFLIQNFVNSILRWINFRLFLHALHCVLPDNARTTTITV
jgi:hypothetical protein